MIESLIQRLESSKLPCLFSFSLQLSLVLGPVIDSSNYLNIAALDNLSTGSCNLQNYQNMGIIHGQVSGCSDQSLVKPARLHFARTARALQDSTCVSEASCPNFEPRAHARLTGLTNQSPSRAPCKQRA